MKKHKSVNWLFIIFVCIVCMIVFYVIIQQDKAFTVEKLVDTDTFLLSPGQIIYFDNFEETDFTCTGLAFDSQNDTFWIADYGALNSSEKTYPRLIEVNSKIDEVLSVIPIAKQVGEKANVQGITYDKSNNSLWAAIGDSVININKDGTVLNQIDLGLYSKYKANGIVYDPGSDTLWVLCYNKYLLNYNKDGELLRTIGVNLKDQDQLCLSENGKLLATVGADYNGEGNYVVEIDINTGEVKVPYNLIGSYAVEGICIVDGNMYIVNDGRYHKAKIQRSYFSLYHVQE